MLCSDLSIAVLLRSLQVPEPFNHSLSTTLGAFLRALSYGSIHSSGNKAPETQFLSALTMYDSRVVPGLMILLCTLPGLRKRL